MKYLFYILSILSLLGSIYWVSLDVSQPEPWLLLIASIGSLCKLIYNEYSKDNKIEKPTVGTPSEIAHSNINSLTGSSQVTVNVGQLPNNGKPDKEVINENKTNEMSKLEKIDSMKLKTNILFIDDESAKFETVKILKDSGWAKTKTVVDIKSTDDSKVREAQIIFVDIHGVGKKLKCKEEGLDLAFMLKEKYPNKFIILYSANRKFDIFHRAIDIVDYKLEKNALPYEFVSLVENFSLQLFNKYKK